MRREKGDATHAESPLRVVDGRVHPGVASGFLHLFELLFLLVELLLHLLQALHSLRLTAVVRLGSIGIVVVVVRIDKMNGSLSLSTLAC